MAFRRALATGVLALVLVACGDDDSGGGGSPEGATLAEAFGRASEELYREAGFRREEDFPRGVRDEDGCLVVGEDGAARIGEAAGFDRDAVEIVGGFVHGAPDESETATCNLRQGEEGVGLSYGTTLRDPEQHEAALRRGNMSDGARVDVEVPGLPEDEVVVFGNEEMVVAAWIGDGFYVSVADRYEDEGTAERMAEALPVAVEVVADALG